MKKTDRFPLAKPWTDRHGKIRWRIRRKGIRAELGAEWGSEEFSRRYAEAVNQSKGKTDVGSDRTVPGTFNDLAVMFYKLHLPSLAESTAADYRAVIEPLRPKHGHKRVAHMLRRHVLDIQADMASTPMQANKTLKRLSQMMDLAVTLEWRTDNPVKGVKRYRTTTGGFHAWDEGEIARFYEVHPMGSIAHRAMTLMLYTGAAKCDAVKLGRGNISDGRIVYRRRKTRANPAGFEVSIPIHPYLAETLTFAKGFTFLETASGEARSANGLGSSMRKWCDAAKLPLCSSHGLRKAICRRSAEIEGDVFKVMAVSGHTDIKEAQKYCDRFNRMNKADSAISRLPSGVDGGQTLANHPTRFAKSQLKPMKRRD